MSDNLELFRQRLPWHGYATDDLLTGLRFYALPEIIQHALVQYQARTSIGWLAYDLDTEGAALAWEDRNGPAPNIVAVNPDNGHAHYFYGLETPVHDYTGASEKALRYVAAIDLGLTAKLGADPGYTKLIAKNPLHERWTVITPRVELYDLAELADWLDLENYLDRRRRLPATGYGRNCTLFEHLRRWAYAECRKSYLNEELFRYAVQCHGMAINADFAPPLPHAEVRATAKSIARWTWRKMSAEGFRAYQKRQSAKGNAVKRTKAQERHNYILDTIRQCPDLSREDIAALCGVSRMTVQRALRAYRPTPSKAVEKLESSRDLI